MWARRGEDAEIRCYSYSLGDTLTRRKELKQKDKAKAGLKIPGQGLALLRCSVELQRCVLAALFAELDLK
jgi:hypothetical protein